MWYPFVRVPIDKKITTVVGANESGKSHLLTAIETSLLGEDLAREDFCRYSNFNSVEMGKLKWSDLGFEFQNLTDEEQQKVRDLCGAGSNKKIPNFSVFRKNQDELSVYLPKGESGDFSEHDIEDADELYQILPHVFRIDAEVAIPASVSIKDLLESQDISEAEALGRKGRFDLMDLFAETRKFFADQSTIQSNAPTLATRFSKYSSDGSASEGEGKRQAEVELARKLICDVAKVDPEALEELYRALRDGKEGHANGLIDQINTRLEASLNFPHWWVQDRDFQLKISPRGFDLVFTIRDRTEIEYSFSERSSGLKFFLSYFVQYLAHEPRTDKSEILLMDEPDAYLSSQAQQDLLKIFEAYASPTDGRSPTQVVYVTHSPFLIDKNHAERIRVLEKGVSDEGTRVVKDAARNHYEPLRSAFGAYVGETTFIGNNNLMVEGIADQILIAGMANFLRHQKGISSLETLDLNRTTIVPAGSASSVPYMTYLARGRDIEKPAVVVLLDSDSAGDEARRKLKKGPYGKRILKDDLILQIGQLQKDDGVKLDNGVTLAETEDLIPLEVCVVVAKLYAVEVCGLEKNKTESFTAEVLKSEVESGTVFDGVKTVFQSVFGEEYHIEKVGFARTVVDVVNGKTPESINKSVLSQMQNNFKVLFREINALIRSAERELSQERVTKKIDRLKKSFLQDNESGATREKAHLLFDDIEASLDNDDEGDAIRSELSKLRRDFDIDNDIAKSISRFDEFKDRLERVKYAGRLATQDKL